MPSSRLDHGPEGQQLERLTFFSDAVFAIAMTLLVIEIKVPHLEHVGEVELAQGLLNLIPHYIGFIVSFLVIGRFWVAHHRIMGLLARTSSKLVWGNLFLLGTVAFMPFPTAVVSELAVLRTAVLFYAGWLTVMGLVHARLVHIALATAGTRRLARADVSDAELRYWRRGSWIAPTIGLVAILGAAIAPWLGLVALIVASPIVPRILRRGTTPPEE